MTDVTNFDEQKLSQREHMDPDKHWIGESLPSPSLGEVTFSGVETSTGESTFPARADHSHDARARFCGLTTVTPKVIPATGSAYIDGLSAPFGTENFLHAGSTQLIDFPQEGAYNIYLHYSITRSSGVFPANAVYELRWDLDNATIPVTTVRENVAEGATFLYNTVNFVTYRGIPTATTNAQLLVGSSDIVNWNFNVVVMEFYRRHSALGALS